MSVNIDVVSTRCDILMSLFVSWLRHGLGWSIWSLIVSNPHVRVWALTCGVVLMHWKLVISRECQRYKCCRWESFSSGLRVHVYGSQWHKSVQHTWLVWFCAVAAVRGLCASRCTALVIHTLIYLHRCVSSHGSPKNVYLHKLVRPSFEIPGC